jgi:hypothetical protein
LDIRSTLTLTSRVLRLANLLSRYKQLFGAKSARSCLSLMPWIPSYRLPP